MNSFYTCARDRSRPRFASLFPHRGGKWRLYTGLEAASSDTIGYHIKDQTVGRLARTTSLCSYQQAANIEPGRRSGVGLRVPPFGLKPGDDPARRQASGNRDPSLGHR